MGARWLDGEEGAVDGDGEGEVKGVAGYAAALVQAYLRLISYLYLEQRFYARREGKGRRGVVNCAASLSCPAQRFVRDFQ